MRVRTKIFFTFELALVAFAMFTYGDAAFPFFMGVPVFLFGLWAVWRKW
jgi:hypothetical protein